MVYQLFEVDWNLEDLIIPDASLIIVRSALLARFMPSMLKADSTRFLAEFKSVGSALFPT